MLEETVRDEFESELIDSYNSLPKKFRKFGDHDSNPFSRESLSAFQKKREESDQQYAIEFRS